MALFWVTEGGDWGQRYFILEWGILLISPFFRSIILPKCFLPLYDEGVCVRVPSVYISVYSCMRRRRRRSQTHWNDASRQRRCTLAEEARSPCRQCCRREWFVLPLSSSPLFHGTVHIFTIEFCIASAAAPPSHPRSERVAWRGCGHFYRDDGARIVALALIIVATSTSLSSILRLSPSLENGFRTFSLFCSDADEVVPSAFSEWPLSAAEIAVRST